jgi:hypothetical protein
MYLKIHIKIMVFIFPKLNLIKYPGCTGDSKYDLPFHTEAEFHYIFF